MSKENRSHKKKPEVRKMDFKISTVEDAKYTFTDQEKVVLALEADTQNAEVVALNGRFDSIKTQFKSDVKTAENRRDEAFRKIRAGHEFRRANVIIDYNTPEKGKKTYYHHQPDQKNIRGEIIYVKDMTEADLQTEMQLNADGEKHSDKPAEPKPGEPLNPVGEAFEQGKRKRAKQKVLTAEIVNDTRLLNAPPMEDPPHITQPASEQ